MTTMTTNQRLRSILYGLGLAACLAATGCQSSIGGQIHPSPYYLDDDVQYYAPGTEFRLQREAAAMKEYKSELELRQQTK